MQGKYTRIPYSPGIIRNRGRSNIVDGKYLATEYLCRWNAVLIGDTSSLNIGLGNYENMLMNASHILPLILPFGNSYVLLNIEVREGEMNLNIESPYQEESIPVDDLGLLAYVAIEIVRREYYKRDPLMRTYEKYYDKFRKIIPQHYRITVNGKHAVFNYWTLEEIYQELSSFIDIVDSSYSFNNKAECRNCPLNRICMQISSNADFLEFKYYRVWDGFPSLYHALKNAGVDALLFLAIYFFKYFPNLKSYENLSNTVKYMSEIKNAAIYHQFDMGADGWIILSLVDGKIYNDPHRLHSENPEIRIFDNSGDVTEFLVLQRIFLEALLYSKKCDKIEDFLGNYPESERYLVYLAFLNIDDFSEDIYYAKGTIDENDDLTLYLNERNGMADLLSKIYESKLYADGFIGFDKENLRIYPTKKLIETLAPLCMEVGE